ncbi:hypothetical protein [Geodermatophilus sp. CPCC 205506]|uniref:hypothetical protein n=1 Tax=Geodermatophilus sp. CPCC 205506 TaxID=2936596 RepID=UPI003EECF667
MTRTRDAAVASQTSTIRLAQAAAVLSVLVVLWQFFSAGRLLEGADALGGHGGGAIVLHVATGLLLVAAVLYGRQSGLWWPAGLAAAVFVLTFVQGALGSSGNIAAHVPVAVVVTIGIVWLTAWAFWPTSI